MEDYENKGRLSVCRIFSLQRTPKLGRTKPSTGPHAARGLDIAALETGSTRKVSLSFWFMTTSRKKAFRISIKSHNIEVKPRNLYQFFKRLMVLQVANFFAHLSCSIILQ